MTALVVPTACYNLRTVSSYFRAAARMVALDLTTGVDWQEYRDSRLINALHTLAFWTGHPGFAVLTDRGPEERERLTNEWHERFLMHWIEKLALHGPFDAMRYYDSVVNIRDMAARGLEERRTEVIAINQAAIGTTNRFIRELAAVRLAGRLGVTALGLVGGPILGPAASLAGNLAFATVDTWEQSSTCRAVLIDPGVDRTLGGAAIDATARGVGNYASGVEVAALSRAGGAEKIINNAQAAIARHQLQLESKLKVYAKLRGKAKGLATTIERRQAEVASNTAVLNTARQTVAKAQMVRGYVHGVAGNISILFAALDVVDAVNEYEEAMDATI